MEITHVIRGEDHVSNTPKQILIYNALGFKVPIFAHLPMILGEDKKRLSKRHGAAGVNEYESMGYQSDALKLFGIIRLESGTGKIFDLENWSRILISEGSKKSISMTRRNSIDNSHLMKDSASS